ncbi:hypothetical protein ACIBL3_27130 [Kribbella sp. NPDC050124]|uniref:hypothetical protein n=1 Tax=Kribbella sp. NPDC050124 TaxID=3364114 RepID=UPI003797DDE1
MGQDEAREHITSALGGSPGEPLSDEERVERERVRNLIQAVAACYNTLVSQETDTGRRTDLVAKLSFHDEEFRRRDTLTPAERAEILRTYPELLERLRAEIGE